MREHYVQHIEEVSAKVERAELIARLAQERSNNLEKAFALKSFVKNVKPPLSTQAEDLQSVNSANETEELFKDASAQILNEILTANPDAEHPHLYDYMGKEILIEEYKRRENQELISYNLGLPTKSVKQKSSKKYVTFNESTIKDIFLTAIMVQSVANDFPGVYKMYFNSILRKTAITSAKADESSANEDEK